MDRWRLGSGDDILRDRLLEAWRPERLAPRQQGGSGPGMGMVMMGATRALEPGVHCAALPDGRLALSDSSAYQVRIYGPEGDAGDPPRVVGRDIAPVPVCPAEEVVERERRLAQLEAGGGPQIQIATTGPGRGHQAVLQEQIRHMLRAQMAAMTFRHEIPIITRLAADADGRLWVERSGGIGVDGSVDLLEADGTNLGSIAPGGAPHPAGVRTRRRHPVGGAGRTGGPLPLRPGGADPDTFTQVIWPDPASALSGFVPSPTAIPQWTVAAGRLL